MTINRRDFVGGLAAALYMRGISCVQIPTTLLAQVDSSVGGKTAIDLGGMKNIVGAFYQPQEVLVDPTFLNTLPPREMKCGLGEIVKNASRRSVRWRSTEPTMVSAVRAAPMHMWIIRQS